MTLNEANPSTRSVTLFSTVLLWTGLALNTGLRHERQATLPDGTAGYKKRDYSVGRLKYEMSKLQDK